MSTTLYQAEQYLNSRGGYSANYFKLRTSIYLEEQSIQNNTSTIRYVIELGANTTSTSARWTSSYYYFTIDRTSNNGISGQVYNQRHASYSGNGTAYGYVTIADYSETLTHNSDGSLVISTTYGGARTQGTNKYVPVDFSVASGNVTVPTIARTSTFSLSASSISLNSGLITLTISPQASNTFEHHVYISCNNDSFTGVAALPTTQTSFTFTLEPNSYGSRLKNTSNYVKFRVYTILNGSTIGYNDSSNVSVSVPSALAPDLTLTTADKNGYHSVFGGFVKDKSVVVVTSTATLKYGATLSGHYISNGSSTTSGTTTTITRTETAQGYNYSSSIVDSRGQTTSKSVTDTYFDYSAPSITNVTIHRTDSNGTANDEGEYITASFTYGVTSLNNKNSIDVYVKYKSSSDSTYTEKAQATSGYSGTISYTFEASTEKTYEVQIAVKDYFTTSTYNSNVSTAFTLVDYGANGKSMSIGKVSSNNGTFEVALDSVFSSKLKGSSGTLKADNNFEVTTTGGNGVLSTRSSYGALMLVNPTSDGIKHLDAYNSSGTGRRVIQVDDNNNITYTTGTFGGNLSVSGTLTATGRVYSQSVAIPKIYVAHSISTFTNGSVSISWESLGFPSGTHYTTVFPTVHSQNTSIIYNYDASSTTQATFSLDNGFSGAVRYSVMLVIA